MVNSVGMFSIGGIASGLDTSGMIAQLMQIERLPVVRLENAQAKLQRVDETWGRINTKLSALRTAVDGLSRPDRFATMIAVSSSNVDAVSVARGTGTTTGSLTFTATQLAAAHQIASGDFTSATDPLGAGTFSVAVGSGTAVDIELDADDTLHDLASKLNAAKGGFTASVVKVDATTHRLVLAGAKTGADQELAVTSTLPQFDPAAIRTLQAAQDAIVQIGADPTFLVTRSSNTISDLVPGASVTLKKIGEEVTVTSSRDTDAAVKAVKSYVDALNGVIRTMADATGYDADAKKGGPLQGDATARQILGSLRSAATAPLGVDLGAIGTAFDVGISVDRKGVITLDETKLKAALTQDFDAVGRLFARTATATDPLVSSATGTSKTTSGIHQVTVSRAADVARVTGAAYTPPGDTEPKTFRITSGGKTATITIDSTSTTAEQAALAMQEALEDVGITGLTASATAADELELETARFGSAATFTVEGLNGDGTVNAADSVFGLAGSHAGVDVQGSFDGGVTTVTGVGQLLTADAGPAEGLAIRWTGTGPSAAPFDVTFSHGLAGGMSSALRAAEGSSGSVARARKGIADRIDVYQTRIDGFEQRLLTRGSTLRRQFTAMETALAQLNAQGNWLSSQLAGLQAYSQQPQQ